MASKLLSLANEELVSENYERAIQLFSEAAEMDSSCEEIYVKRAQAYIKTDNYTGAAADCDKAITLNSSNPQAYLQKGISYFCMKDYSQAIEALKQGQSLDGSEPSFQSWIDKSESELQTLSAHLPSQVEDNSSEVSTPTKPKLKYDWYQTATHVTVTVLMKNVKKEDFTSDIQENVLKVTIKQDGGQIMDQEINLANPIVPEQSSHKVMSTKVEVKLKKKEGIQWTILEGSGQGDKLKIPMKDVVEQKAPQYPTSSNVTRDWDQLAKDVAEEEKSEKKEGDAALNSLFQQIYSDGTDEVKRAMIKSFYESGGTVLSTNWTEVGKDKVDAKPPDGMEWKKY